MNDVFHLIKACRTTLKCAPCASEPLEDQRSRVLDPFLTAPSNEASYVYTSPLLYSLRSDLLRNASARCQHRISLMIHWAQLPTQLLLRRSLLPAFLPTACFAPRLRMLLHMRFLVLLDSRFDRTRSNYLETPPAGRHRTNCGLQYSVYPYVT